MNKIKTGIDWITNLGNLAKVLPLVFAITGGIAWYNSQVIKKYNERNSNRQLSENVTIVIAQIDSLFSIVDIMKVEQKDLKRDVMEKLGSVESTIDIVKGQMANHLVKTATKEDIMNWIKAFEKKNYNWSEGSSWLIQR